VAWWLLKQGLCTYDVGKIMFPVLPTFGEYVKCYNGNMGLLQERNSQAGLMTLKFRGFRSQFSKGSTNINGIDKPKIPLCNARKTLVSPVGPGPGFSQSLDQLGSITWPGNQTEWSIPSKESIPSQGNP
jgi:hypothetical protein